MNYDELIRTLNEGTCPICGSGGFRVVLGHISQVHGQSGSQFREACGLNRQRSLCTPEASNTYSRVAIQTGAITNCRKVGHPQLQHYTVRTEGKANLSKGGRERWRSLLKTDAGRAERQRLIAIRAASGLAKFMEQLTPTKRAKLSAAHPHRVTRDQETMIQGLYAAGETLSSLAQLYTVSRPTIRRVLGIRKRYSRTANFRDPGAPTFYSQGGCYDQT